MKKRTELNEINNSPNKPDEKTVGRILLKYDVLSILARSDNNKTAHLLLIISRISSHTLEISYQAMAKHFVR